MFEGFLPFLLDKEDDEEMNHREEERKEAGAKGVKSLPYPCVPHRGLTFRARSSPETLSLRDKHEALVRGGDAL